MIPGEDHSKRLVLSALENWQVEMNQVAIVDHRDTLEVLAIEEQIFWQLGLESRR